MRAILLNPPKKGKKGKRAKGKRRSAWRRAKPRYSKGCLKQVRRYSLWKKYHKVWSEKRKTQRAAAAAERAAKREKAKAAKEARKAAKMAKQAKASPEMPEEFMPRGLAANPRRRRNSSTWIPAFRNGRGRRHRRNATFSYGTAYTRRNDGGSTWLPAFRNPYWVPRYATNPGVVGALTKPFQPKLLLGMTPYVGGALGNAILSTWLRNLGFMPQMLKSGIGGSVVNLASAGLLGAGVGMISPRLAGPVFMGGVVDTVISMFNEYLKPVLGLKGCAGCGDYLTPGNAAGALPLGYMQEYLTTADAANAQALGGLEDTYSLPDLPSDVAPYNPVTFA